MLSRIPEKIDQGRFNDCTIREIYSNYKDHLGLVREGKKLITDTSDRYVCGYPVPSFQRKHVWTAEQDIAFIESAWLGIPLGTYNIHNLKWETVDGATMAIKFSGWVIDGQQRLTALERYWNNQFPVFGLYWKDLTEVESRRFLITKFCYYESSLWNETLIRDLYNRLSFGGTPHKPEDRA